MAQLADKSKRLTETVWTMRAPYPLAKLVLVYMAAGANDGQAHIDIGRAASFCGVTKQNLVAALDDLVRDRILVPTAAGGYRFGGFVEAA